MAGNILTGLGVVVFAIGFFRKSRNLMLLGTLFIFFGPHVSAMAAGFEAGIKSTLKSG